MSHSRLSAAVALVWTAVLPAQAPRIQIHILEGNGAINYFNQRMAQEPIVQIEDENRRPIGGVAVLFRLPESGPSGIFPNGTHRLLVITDQNGRAAARGIVVNDVPGQLQIGISATYLGVEASATVTQVIRKPVVMKPPKPKLISSTKLWIIAGAAAGAAAGGIAIAVGSGHGAAAPQGNPTGAAVPSPPTSVSSGGTSVGPPR